MKVASARSLCLVSTALTLSLAPYTAQAAALPGLTNLNFVTYTGSNPKSYFTSVDPTGWTGEQNAGNPGDYMRVVTTYTYTFFTPFIGNFFPGGVSTIMAQSTYRNELFSS